MSTQYLRKECKCGVTFAPYRSTQTFCKPKCPSRRRLAFGDSVTCCLDSCTKTFIPTNKNKKVCSDQCRAILRAERDKERRKNPEERKKMNHAIARCKQADKEPEVLKALDSQFWGLCKPKKKPVKRRCLRCSVKFSSIEFRMCSQCQGVAARSSYLAGNPYQRHSAC